MPVELSQYFCIPLAESNPMLHEIQKHLDQLMLETNNRENPAFEGYSPFEMEHILYDTFGDMSPIQLQHLTENEYNTIPMLSQIKYLVNLIAEAGELKLTAKGFLPTQIVSDIYNQGFIKDKYIETGFIKLFKETDFSAISLTRMLPVMAGIVKKRKNHLSLTKSGEKTITDNYKLLRLILETMGHKFNWAYFDLYGSDKIGQLGYGFSLILLHKYGDEKRVDGFYADKYFTAFPGLLAPLPPGIYKNEFAGCYALRTFERFLNYFGVIEYKRNRMESETMVQKTPLFDKLIKLLPHKATASTAIFN